MAVLLSFMRSAICVAATLWFVSTLPPSPAAAAEIIVESVKPPHSGTAVNSYGVTRADFQRIASSIPAIRELVPSRVMPQQAVFGERKLGIELIGTTERFAKWEPLKIMHGRFLSGTDDRSRKNVAVIDALTAQRLFPGDEAIGKNIRIADHYFLIVGQLAASSDAKADKKKSGGVYIPLTAMRSRYGDTVVQRRTGSIQMEKYELSRIRVILESAEAAERVSTVIKTLLKKYHEKLDYSVRISYLGAKS